MDADLPLKDEACPDTLAFGRRCFASKSAIAQILAAVRRDGLPDHSSRTTQFRKRKAFASTPGRHGPLVCALTLAAGLVVGVQNPAAMLLHCSEHCDGFRNLMSRTAEKVGVDTPWSIILYADGVSPADTLSKNDQRKFYAIYWSLKEFGQAALGTEEVWFTLAVVRTTQLDKLPGGLNALLGILFDKCFFNPAEGLDFSSSGILLPLIGGSFLLRCILKVFIGDEPALKDMLNSKGHAGVRCCALCSNCTLSKYWTIARDAGRNVRHTELEIETRVFERTTDEMVKVIMNTLEEKKALVSDNSSNFNSGDFDELQLRLGFNHTPNNFCRKPYVNPISVLMFDWMHIYLVGGLLDHEFGLCMKALKRASSPNTYVVLRTFLSHWAWPRSINVKLDRLLNDKSIKSNLASGHFGSTASELLSLVPVLALYFATVCVPHGACLPLVFSLLACLDVVELLMLVKEGVVPSATIGAAVIRHLSLRREAYGAGIDDQALKPHQSGHIAELMDRHDGDLFSCFVQERHHRLLTKYALPRKNTAGYEVGIVEDITVEQTQALHNNWFATGVSPPHKPRPHTARALAEIGFDKVEESSSIRTPIGTLHVGDAVGYRAEDGSLCFAELIVLFRLIGDTHAHAIVNVWPGDGAGPGHTVRVQHANDNLRVIPAHKLEVAFLHTRSDGSGKGLIALSPKYRCLL